jgi:hypothetical protein
MTSAQAPRMNHSVDAAAGYCARTLFGDQHLPGVRVECRCRGKLKSILEGGDVVHGALDHGLGEDVDAHGFAPAVFAPCTQAKPPSRGSRVSCEPWQLTSQLELSRHETSHGPVHVTLHWLTR